MNRYAGFWKDQREQRKLTQLEMARMLGVSSVFISRVETEKAKFTLRQMQNLIAIFRLNLEEVLDLLLSEEEAKIRQILGDGKITD